MYIPEITSNLRKDIIKVPAIIREQASGIKLFGKHIKSLIFSTDIAIIMNTDADAVIAVYPFTPQLGITKAITEAANIPVLCGVGGGLTNGLRSANIALHAEFQGVFAVVLNAPASFDTIQQVSQYIDIPVVVTVVSEYADVEEKLRAGASIVNVSGAKKTAFIVRKIRERYPELPIIATGGPTEELILETIQAGANAITYTPPTNAELFKLRMEQYRIKEGNESGKDAS
ncbi:hydrolase [Parabacteroides sp. Marseille-P3160]|uniref:hydrolase n=1 Tax=Parabacteroides sp. Marseille-P3160 TaxID=1917887 RepID=UPI0009BBC4F2|nr:hydrolase [Parabacteroides sp. Marseille-P3160]